MKKYLQIILFSGLILEACSQPNQLVQTIEDDIDYINDGERYSVFLKKSKELYYSDKITPAEKLIGQLKDGTNQIKLPVAPDHVISTAENYAKNCKGVLMVGQFFNCGNCPKDHLTVATGFVISNEGYCVSNYHVFKPDTASQNKDLAFFVMDYDGNVFNIEKIVAASETNDLVIFKVGVEEFPIYPIELGEMPEIGDDVLAMSHPDGRNYTLTKGIVSRYYERSGDEKRMNITAEYAKGSSGGPLLNNKGNIIGVVSSTVSIHYYKDRELQMVMRECIPVNLIKELVE